LLAKELRLSLERKKREKGEKGEKYAEVMKPSIAYLWGSHVRLRLL
jgi:hypothetical protein